MVDESPSAGVVGPTGHGVAEQFNAYGLSLIHIFSHIIGGYAAGYYS